MFILIYQRVYILLAGSLQRFIQPYQSFCPKKNVKSKGSLGKDETRVWETQEKADLERFRGFWTYFVEVSGKFPHLEFALEILICVTL